MSIHPSLRLLYVMELFSGLSRGSYLVCIGWSTLVITNDVSRVGQVFIVAMMSNLLGGPVIGTIVDRQSRTRLIIYSHLGIATCLAALAFFWLPVADPGILWLFLAVWAITTLRLMHNSSHDGLLQSFVKKQVLVSTIASFRGLHLISTVAGTLAAGIVIERISPAAGFYLSAICSAALVVPMLFVGPVLLDRKAKGFSAFLKEISDGARIFVHSRSFRLIAILAGVSLPVGQLSNAILSSFVRDDLGKGSDVFGLVDAAWPLGGMLAAILLGAGIRVLYARNSEYIFAALAGVSTIFLALSVSIPAIVLFHGAMGLTVWLCRIVIDSRILETSAPENVGKTKSGIEMAFSASALAMCLSPTIVTLPSTSGYFLFWGCLIVVATGLLWLVGRSE